MKASVNSFELHLQAVMAETAKERAILTKAVEDAQTELTSFIKANKVFDADTEEFKYVTAYRSALVTAKKNLTSFEDVVREKAFRLSTAAGRKTASEVREIVTSSAEFVAGIPSATKKSEARKERDAARAAAYRTRMAANNVGAAKTA